MVARGEEGGVGTDMLISWWFGDPGLWPFDVYLWGLLAAGLCTAVSAAQYVARCRVDEMNPEWFEGEYIYEPRPRNLAPAFGMGVYMIGGVVWPVVVAGSVVYAVFWRVLPWLWDRGLGAPWRGLVALFERRYRRADDRTRTLADREAKTRRYLADRVDFLEEQDCTGSLEYVAVKHSLDMMS